MADYWLGADPGGKNKFGLAFLERSGDLCSFHVSSVDEAVNKIDKIIQPDDKLLGLGIDAPMWWSTRVS